MKQVKAAQSILIPFFALILSSCSTPQAITKAEVHAQNIAIQASEDSATHTTIRFLEARIQRDPDDFIANNKLASAYQQRLRETGDINYLYLAARAAQASLATLPAEQNNGGLVALTQIAYSSHDFAAARNHAQRLTELEPNKGYTFQLLGDALLELGQYEDAIAAFRQMEKLGGLQGLTKVSIEQRLARLALLYGDPPRAVQHFSEALKLTSTAPLLSETMAWCQWQLGETAFSVGDYPLAEKHYQDSLLSFPDYFRSLAALGRVRFARGDSAGAIALYEKVVHILPDPSFIATLGDLYQLAGRVQDAENQYALVEQIGKLAAQSGTLYNRQLALFYADHDLKPEAAYRNATKEYMTRRDIYGADAVAWTALKAGKINAAQSAIKEALKLGTKDAKLFYHAGMIARAAGDSVEAQRWLKAALTLNPEFDPLQAEYARKALRALQ